MPSFDGVDEALMGIEVHGLPFVGILASDGKS